MNYRDRIEKVGKKIMGIILLMILLLTVIPLSSNADDMTNQHWNIMLVIDGSADFQNADKDHLRFEAVNSFLDTLWTGGDYVGAIVTQVRQLDNLDQYNNSIVSDTWKNGAVKLDSNRETLKEQIRKAPTINFKHDKDTDLGSAVLLAAKRLEEAQQINGLPSAVILITNSVTNFNNSRAEENKAEAIALMQSCGIRMGAVYYNDNEEQKTEIRDFVTAANGLSAGDLTIAERYSEIYELTDIASALDDMLRMLGISIPETNDYFTDSGERTFSVPGIGIEELNLRFRTVNGTALPSGFAVDIVRPNGKSLSDSEMKSIYSKGNSYVNYKITTDLIGGEWKVRLTVPENSVAIQFDRIFNTSIETGITISPEPSELHSNMNATITAYLLKSGEKITDSQAYMGYECKLVLTDAENGSIKEIKLEQNKNGEYSTDLSLDFYGKYYVKSVFNCNEFYSDSDSILIDLSNRTPECRTPQSIEIPCSIFENNEYSIDCSKYASDVEDNVLSYALGETTLNQDAIYIKGSKLYIDPYNAGSGENTIYVRAIDSQGAFSTIKIPVNIVVADIKAVMETTPSSDSLHAYIEDGVSVTAYMTDNDVKIEEAYKYKEYTCYLVIRDAETKEVQDTVELPPDGSGIRSKTIPLNFYGEYEAYVMFDGEFPISSKAQIWNLTNREPQCTDIDKPDEIYIKFFKNELRLPIADNIKDLEDGQDALNVELLSEDPNGAIKITDDNSYLVVNLDLLPKAEIYLKVTDSQGASSNLKISYEVKDYTLLAGISAGVLILIIVLCIFIVIRKKNAIVPEGVCTLEFEFVNDDDDEKTLQFEVTPPGKGSKRKTNLYEMILQDMRRSGGMLRQACDGEHVEFRDVESFIENLANELKKIEIVCVIKKQRGRGKIGKVKVINGRDSTVLYNSGKKVLPGGHAFIISYYNYDRERDEE